MAVTREQRRLLEAEARTAHWRRWGPYLSERQWGVPLGGALKNIIAIAAGIVSGLGLGENARSLLMTRGSGRDGPVSPSTTGRGS